MSESPYSASSPDNIKYSWRIDSFLRKDTENLQNVIYSITWTRTALDLNSNLATSISSNIFLEVPINSEEFIPYDQITQQKVIEWIEDDVDLERLTENLMKNIEHNRRVVHSPEFPWN